MEDLCVVEVSDEGSDMSAAVEQGSSLQVPIGAHVQQSELGDIYITEIKQLKLKKDGSRFKEIHGQCG